MSDMHEIFITRQAGEAITIPLERVLGKLYDEDGREIVRAIDITVLSIHDDKVQLEIQHPKAIPVHRKDVEDACRRCRDCGLPSAGPQCDKCHATQFAKIFSMDDIVRDMDAAIDGMGRAIGGKA